MATRRLDRGQARRIAVRAQLLDARPPQDLVDTVDHLTLLQVDPTAAIAPNADLVAWSRLGTAYRPADLVRALEHDRTLFELNAYVRPASAVALHLSQDADRSGGRGGEWVAANDGFRRDVLARLREAGPLLSRDVPDTSRVPWVSTGWTHDRNVTQMLELLAARGEVAVAGRVGRQRLWDVADRVLPPFEPLPADVALRRRQERRLRSLGLVRARPAAAPGEPTSVGDAGVPVTVEGVDGRWRADPDALDALDRPFTGRTALLSPFDRLVHDRERALALFGFEYVLEMYKPAASRRWGYFALPVLQHDRLVGKLDAKVDRPRGVLTVHAVHEDVPFGPGMRAQVDAEIEALAAWLGVAVTRG